MIHFKFRMPFFNCCKLKILVAGTVLITAVSCFTLQPASLSNPSNKECKKSIADALWKITMKHGGLIALSEDDPGIAGLASLQSGQARYGYLNNMTYCYALTKKKGKPYLTLLSKEGDGVNVKNTLTGIMSVELTNCNCKY